MYMKYVATVSDDFRKVVSGGTFDTYQEARDCADRYNMGADYSHMNVFAVETDQQG